MSIFLSEHNLLCSYPFIINQQSVLKFNVYVTPPCLNTKCYIIIHFLLQLLSFLLVVFVLLFFVLLFDNTYLYY